MNSNIVFDVNDIFDRLLALLTIYNELLNLYFLNFRHTDHEVGKQFELSLELVLFPNLVCGCIDVLHTGLERA